MKLSDLTRLRWLLGTLLIAGAALFAVGIATEGDSHGDSVASVESGDHSEATEQTEHNAQTEASESGGETILGIYLESTPLVVVAVMASVVLAAATWRNDHRLILRTAALFAAAFAVLDVVELSNQIRRSAATIAVIAAVIAVMHAAAVFLAEQRRSATP